jgi:manganese-dependent inorganic pyrophosphatase
LKEAKERKTEIVNKLKEMTEKENLAFNILMVTDIIKEGSEVIIVGDIDYIEKVLKSKIKDNSIYVPGMMSRKKDLVPKLM